ncbi:unnamed protein product [Peronospora farinosa]|uniref:Uncharacterized protein n=1 Tax=Peronospora farinosa TaxID=134698 RepID=A0AAV0SW74_9STRA|nr:unnamed protein product [Peronospora farinosa]CAI5709599.1 unnamed protein product [Peronospora farinosa]
MKVFTGLLVVALAVTSSYADNSSNLRSTRYDDEVNEVKAADSHDSKTTNDKLIVDSADYVNSEGKINIMDIIGEEKGKIPLVDILDAYVDSSEKDVDNFITQLTHKEFSTQATDFNDNNSLPSKTDGKPNYVNVKDDDDSDIQDNEDSDSDNNVILGKSGKSTKSNESLKNDNLDDLYSDTNVKDDKHQTRVEGTGMFSQGSGKPKRDTHAKESFPDDDLDDSYIKTNVKDDKYETQAKDTADDAQNDDEDPSTLKTPNSKDKKSMSDEEDVNQNMLQSEILEDDEATKLSKNKAS